MHASNCILASVPVFCNMIHEHYPPRSHVLRLLCTENRLFSNSNSNMSCHTITMLPSAVLPNLNSDDFPDCNS